MLFVNKKYESLYKILNEGVDSSEITNEEEIIDEASGPKYSSNDEIWNFLVSNLGHQYGHAFIRLPGGRFIYNERLIAEGDEIPDGVSYLMKASENEYYVINYIKSKRTSGSEEELLSILQDAGISVTSVQSSKLEAKDTNGNTVYFKVMPTSKDVKPEIYHWKPSAEDWEMVIAFAYNRNYISNYQVVGKNGRKKKDAEARDAANMSYVSGSSSRQASDKVLSYYLEHQDSIDGIVSNLYDQSGGQCGALRKLPTAEVNLSEAWQNEGGTDRTPKTDVIDASGNYKMSFKKVGGAQLMSGVKGEANATLKCVYNKLFDSYKGVKSLKKKAENITKQLLAIFNDENAKWASNTKYKSNVDELYKEGQRINALLQDRVRALLADSEFKTAVVDEAIRGEIKFGGKDKEACASHLFIWDHKGKSRLWDAEVYAKSHANAVAVTVDFKSSKGSSSTVLRLASKSTIDDPIKSVK